jgi:hypothetical protein
MKNPSSLSFVTALAVLSLALPVKAALLQFDSRTAFDLAVSDQTTEDFENLGASAASSGYVALPASFTDGPLTIDNGTADTYAVYKGAFGGANDGSTYLLPDGSGTGEVFSLASGTATALGLDIFSTGSAETDSGVVTLSQGQPVDFTASAPVGDGSPSDVGFVGFVETTPGVSILSIGFPSADNTSDAFDNVSFGTVVAPEPSVFVMLLGGVSAFFLFRKLRKTRI